MSCATVHAGALLLAPGDQSFGEDMNIQFRVLSFLAVAIVWSTNSSAQTASIDQFSLQRDGIAVFTDDFNDGVAPPSAPSFSSGVPLSYFVQGSFPAGSESGGFLRLDSANGALGTNAIEAPRRSLVATLLTSITGGSTQLGIGNTLSESGVFSLTSPAGPLFSTYGIRFTDSLTVPQVLQLGVRFNDATRRTEIYYVYQDFVANTISTLATVDLAPPVGADEIQFTLSRPSTSNNNFFASFSFLSGGHAIGNGGSFETAGALFRGQNAVRGQFFAAQAVTPVPEPETYALMLAGFAWLGLAARRRSRVRAS